MVALFDHRYVYGDVPPVTLKSMLPVLFPLQSTSTWVVLKANAAAGSVIVALVVAVHPFVSVTVTE